jgi:hypothetical protein
MWLVLSELLIKCKYEPKVSMAGGSIMSLTLKIDGTSVSISPPDAPPDDKVPYIPTEDLFRRYMDFDLRLKEALRNKETKSTYSKSLRKALLDGDVPLLFRSPLIYGDDFDDANLTAHDMNKAYTSLLRNIKMVPVFNDFDEFEMYDDGLRGPAMMRHTDEVCDPDCDMSSVCSDPSPPITQVPHAPFQVDDKTQTSVESYCTEPIAVSDKDIKTIIYNFRQEHRSNAFILKEFQRQMGIDKTRVEPFLFSERERHAFYLVQRTGVLLKDDPKLLLLDQDYNLVSFQTWLVVRDWDWCSTLGVIKPSKLVPVDVGKVIDDLWADTLLPVALKKFLGNKHVGLCGKRFNKKNDTLIFTDNDEAQHYFKQLGGKKHGAEYFPDVIGGRKLHFVTRSRQTPLADGFYPIQHLIYDQQRMALYKRAVDVGRPVIAVKVDCLWFKGFKAQTLVPKDNSAKGMGSWAVLKSDGHPVKEFLDKSKFMDWDKYLPETYNEPLIVDHPIADEWDFNTFKDIFDKFNCVIVLANIPGAGKTHSLINYCRPLGSKALFVCPYNALADDLMKCKCASPCADKCEYAVTAITLHNLLGLMGGDTDDTKKPYDISEVSHIVFDEVFCHTTYMLSAIRRFIRQNRLMSDGTDRKFFAAGDNNQNSPIEKLSLERLEKKAYYMNCVSTIFDSQITLEVCKRVSTDAERATLVEIKNLVLHTSTPLINIARRFFKPITTLEQVRGMSVCYLNETARLVNNFMNAKEVASKVPGSVVKNACRNYWVGQTLRCRKRLTVDKTKLHINYIYTVSAVADKGLVLKSSLGVEYVVSFASLSECFAYNYAHTCHSLQGMSVATGITLHDLAFFFVTREWFYTALTRSRNLAEIFYWDPSVVLHDLQVVKVGELELRIERKIAGHRKADADAGRGFDEADYITVEDVKDLLDTQEYCCSKCREVVMLSWKDAKDGSQFTIDRINNTEAHVRHNCLISCLKCNRATH